MWTMRKVISEGERSPFGYGFAWDDPLLSRDWRFVYYPIGLHLVMRFLRWVQIRCWMPGRRAIQFRKDFHRRVHQGRQDIYNFGHRDGYKDGLAQSHSNSYDEGFEAGRESTFEQLKGMIK